MPTSPDAPTVLIPPKPDPALAAAVSPKPPESLREEMRKHALRSTYYFATAVCGFGDLAAIHDFMARWYDADRGNRRLGIAPRSSLKTSVWTIAGCLRRATVNPNLRILLSTEKVGNAEKWILLMQRIITSPVYRWLWPELVPKMGDVRWNQSQLELVRTALWPEPTIEAAGVGTASTSNHYEYVHEDDLLGETTYQSPIEVQKAIDDHKLKESLLVRPEDPICTVGTRWRVDDVIGWMIENEGAKLDTLRLSIYKPNGETIWPEKFSLEYVASLRQKYGPALFALLYENEPLASGAVEFQAEWLRWWKWDHSIPEEPAILLEVPGGKDRPPTTKRVVIADCTTWQVTDCGLVDEDKRGAARTANVIVLLTPPEISENDQSGDAGAFDIVLVVADAKRTAPKDTLDRAHDFYLEWDPSVAFLEVFGAHEVFFRWAVERFPNMRLRRLPTDTRKSKQSRIREFSPFATQGRFYIHREHTEFLSEWVAFPTGKTVDLLDALAWLPRVWVPPEAKNKRGFRLSDWLPGDETDADAAETTRSKTCGY